MDRFLFFGNKKKMLDVLNVLNVLHHKSTLKLFVKRLFFVLVEFKVMVDDIYLN